MRRDEKTGQANDFGVANEAKEGLVSPKALMGGAEKSFEATVAFLVEVSSPCPVQRDVLGGGEGLGDVGLAMSTEQVAVTSLCGGQFREGRGVDLFLGIGGCGADPEPVP
ncbi:hypothetical protein ACU635_31525 [[Actinomadura] parvosata]|uniref:hypothetical protein n=1 Tax=[Actinomadura] parvosata TaxID=1955412 RepID=UPI00406CBD2E